MMKHRKINKLCWTWTWSHGKRRSVCKRSKSATFFLYVRIFINTFSFLRFGFHGRPNITAVSARTLRWYVTGSIARPSFLIGDLVVRAFHSAVCSSRMILTSAFQFRVTVSWREIPCLLSLFLCILIVFYVIIRIYNTVYWLTFSKAFFRYLVLIVLHFPLANNNNMWW